jgi:hypothetical protein
MAWCAITGLQAGLTRRVVVDSSIIAGAGVCGRGPGTSIPLQSTGPATHVCPQDGRGRVDAGEGMQRGPYLFQCTWRMHIKPNGALLPLYGPLHRSASSTIRSMLLLLGKFGLGARRVKTSHLHCDIYIVPLLGRTGRTGLARSLFTATLRQRKGREQPTRCLGTLKTALQRTKMLSIKKKGSQYSVGEEE